MAVYRSNLRADRELDQTAQHSQVSALGCQYQGCCSTRWGFVDVSAHLLHQEPRHFKMAVKLSAARNSGFVVVVTRTPCFAQIPKLLRAPASAASVSTPRPLLSSAICADRDGNHEACVHESVPFLPASPNFFPLPATTYSPAPHFEPLTMLTTLYWMVYWPVKRIYRAIYRDRARDQTRKLSPSHFRDAYI
jgi:hypothetical protein